ncbi:unnamed protein product [Miscanthus lutarioriparius]|uniref:Uncharacterized protein n=1 Tax=Miscanthus lutarioriparius TaxID=422564 RepID=A0A811RTS9_9POAL|nr:unnamed protein product [Miscanthus lutarioriparius]
MCTLQQRGRVFVLTLTGDGEHRLGHALISSLRSAVASATKAAAKAGTGCALVTVGEGCLFSNSLDIGWASTSRTRLSELADALRPRRRPPRAAHAHHRHHHGARLHRRVPPRALP